MITKISHAGGAGRNQGWRLCSQKPAMFNRRPAQSRGMCQLFGFGRVWLALDSLVELAVQHFRCGVGAELAGPRVDGRPQLLEVLSTAPIRFARGEFEQESRCRDRVGVHAAARPDLTRRVGFSCLFSALASRVARVFKRIPGRRRRRRRRRRHPI